jgi:hypothetical protein
MKELERVKRARMEDRRPALESEAFPAGCMTGVSDRKEIQEAH